MNEKCISIEKKFIPLKIKYIIPLFKRDIFLDSNKKNKQKDNKKNGGEILFVIPDKLIIFS